MCACASLSDYRGINRTVAGVAIGAGWQAYVAYVNIVCYYLVGIPIGIIMGYVFDMGVKVIDFFLLFLFMSQNFALLLILI